MPALGTRGGASALGFGLFGLKQVFIQGAYGLFNLGNRSVQNMKYAWAPEAVGYARSFPSSSTPQAAVAAGNSTMAIFAMNINSTGAHQGTAKYLHASDNTSAGANLTNGAYYSGGATGNATVGLFYAGGYDSSTPKLMSTIYTYSGDTCAAGGSLIYASLGGSATGNATVSVANRAGRAGGSAANDVYTYATNTQSTGTAFPVSHSYGNRYWGSDTTGYTQGTSADTRSTQKYQYASNTTAAGIQLTQFAFTAQGASCDTYAIISGDSLSSTVKYTYATETQSIGVAFLPPQQFQGGAVSNGQTGVNA